MWTDCLAGVARQASSTAQAAQPVPYEQTSRPAALSWLLHCAQSKATLLTRSDGQLAQSSLTYPCPPTQFHLLASQYKA